MGLIGKMDRRIEIKQPVKTKSAQGATINTFAHLCYKMASRVAAGESPESFANNRIVVATRYKYRVHITSAINETMRIIDDNIQYNILQVMPDAENALFIEMLAEKVTE
jgi:SPP1 family predicted phage head-tail adaptor